MRNFNYVNLLSKIKALVLQRKYEWECFAQIQLKTLGLLGYGGGEGPAFEDFVYIIVQ
jgi:hypothetical protein